MGQQTNSQQVCKSTSVYSIGLDLGGCNGPRTPRVGQDHLCSLGLEHGCDVLQLPVASIATRGAWPSQATNCLTGERV